MTATILVANQMEVGSGRKEIHGNQPPKKHRVIKDDIRIMLAYSAKKKRTKPTAEYSTLKPETNSDSASGRSKGTLLVSAKAEIKNKKKEGKKGHQKKIGCCAKTIAVKLVEPVKSSKGIMTKAIETS